MHLSWNKKYESERYHMVPLGGNGLIEVRCIVDEVKSSEK